MLVGCARHDIVRSPSQLLSDLQPRLSPLLTYPPLLFTAIRSHIFTFHDTAFTVPFYIPRSRLLSSLHFSSHIHWMHGRSLLAWAGVDRWGLDHSTAHHIASTTTKQSTYSVHIGFELVFFLPPNFGFPGSISKHYISVAFGFKQAGFTLYVSFQTEEAIWEGLQIVFMSGWVRRFFFQVESGCSSFRLQGAFFILD